MRSRIILALDNLKALLNAADMNLANVVQFNVYTADLDEAMRHFDVMGPRFGPEDAAPPMTIRGVTRLALPPPMFDLKATSHHRRLTMRTGSPEVSNEHSWRAVNSIAGDWNGRMIGSIETPRIHTMDTEAEWSLLGIPEIRLAI